MASTSKKLAREFYGPSMFEVTLGAALSLLLGGFLAAGYLVAQPVETVRSMPREPDPEKVYYVTGSARSSLGKQWLRKKQMLTESGAAEIRLSEDELNTWMSSSKSKPDAEETAGIFSAKSINFRVQEGTLQVGVPCDLSLPFFKKSVVVQARGQFVERGGRFEYSPDEVMIGQLAAHRLPLLGSLVMGAVTSTYETPEDLSAAWDTLNEVSVDGKALLLVRR